MIEYSDIENTVEEKGNMGGIAQQVFFAPKKDFLELAKKPDWKSTRNFAGMNLLSVGSDRMKAGKKLYRAYATLEKAELLAERQGEFDGISHKISLKLFVPGLTSEALAMLSIPNQDWIFYAEDGDQMFRIGNERFAAKLAPEGQAGTGRATSDAKGNEMVFTSYEVGFAGEVTNIDYIKSLVNVVDEGLTVTYLPAHGATLVLVDATPTITFGEAVVSADTLQAFTPQELESVITLKELDVDGNVVADKAFTAGIAANVVTITPTSNFSAATIFELKLDATKILSADTKGRMAGSDYVRFTTA